MRAIAGVGRSGCERTSSRSAGNYNLSTMRRSQTLDREGLQGRPGQEPVTPDPFIEPRLAPTG